jgi:hypothetical protein
MPSGGAGDASSTTVLLVRLYQSDAQCLVDPSSAAGQPACRLLVQTEQEAVLQQLGSDVATGRRLLQAAPAQAARTLTCGAESKALFGSTGYESRESWCSRALAFLQNREHRAWQGTAACALPPRSSQHDCSAPLHVRDQAPAPCRAAAALTTASAPTAEPPESPIAAEGSAVPVGGTSATTRVVQATTTAAVSLLASLWVFVSGTLTLALSHAPALSPLHSLGRLLHAWGAPSSIGLQALLAQLQLVGSSLLVSPPQMRGYREVAQGAAWATLLQWDSGELLRPPAPSPPPPLRLPACIAPARADGERSRQPNNATPAQVAPSCCSTASMT